ncbi:two-component sensor histidine kinase [Cylindrospermopsis raciborskii CENA303]|uniref:histidine kinase n=1 Tax=Cylindrospermopsis raciborskii CENA303 TaxID=1170769 RepID=A0A1X4G7D8_9CYAN|nr:ATP-binding protein [Cylindrospermopsis raciborskii]OSO90945.1 two-component sensor histidine kinase [Cylindrospermopsis raciborskii CENA303]
MFQATRRRLALWYTAITAILLLLFATGVYWYVHSTLIERIDDTLNHVVEVVERSLVIEKVNLEPSQLKLRYQGVKTPKQDTVSVNIEASFRNNTSTNEDDHIDLEWFTPTGELRWSTFSEPLHIPIRGNTNETVQVMGGWGNSELLLRQVTHRVEIGRHVLGYLRVSHPWFEVTKPSRKLVVDLGLGIGLMVISVGASGWFLSGKAMEPVGDSYQRLKQFTADASHELRSPIALIQTNVQVALADLESENSYTAHDYEHNYSHYRQQLQLVERLTQRLGRLVNDLLFLARQDNGMSPNLFSPCPMDALLMEVVEEQELVATEKQVPLSLILVDPPVGTDSILRENWFTLMGNWDQLGRLCTNLISNALQYTPREGKVQVELARVLTMPRPCLQIKVIDTGVGIPKESLPKLFDRFYRVDPARSQRDATTGSGLGLAIVHTIVEQHQGEIQVHSIVGQGTTFVVHLPVGSEFY